MMVMSASPVHATCVTRSRTFPFNRLVDLFIFSLLPPSRSNALGGREVFFLHLYAESLSKRIGPPRRELDRLFSPRSKGNVNGPPPRISRYTHANPTNTRAGVLYPTALYPTAPPAPALCEIAQTPEAPTLTAARDIQLSGGRRW